MTVDFQLADVISIGPAIFLFLASLMPLTIKTLKGDEPPPLLSVGYICLGVIAAAVMATVFYSQSHGNVFYAFSQALVIDGVSCFASVLVALLTGVAAILSMEHAATSGRQFSEYLFLLTNAAVGMLILAWSNDLIVTFIAIEIMSLCLYLLIALSHEERLSKEAAFKYFVLGSFASAIFLYGLAFIYGIAGTTYIDKLAEVAPKLSENNMLFTLGVGFAVIGFCFKVAIVPFHAWTPDVYEGSPTPVTGFMATAVKVVTFVAFLRFINLDFVLPEVSGDMMTILQWFAVLTMTAGNIAAIVQNGLKRMLAYSSIAHSGYVLIGLVAAGVGGNSWLGSSGVLYYVFAYSIMTLGAFAVVTQLEGKENDLILVDELRGLAKRRPWTAAAFAIFLLSLAGIPPTVGFFGKFFIFSAAIQQGFLWLAVWGALNSVIAAYYYLRPIVLMYMREEPGVDVHEQYKFTPAITLALAGMVVVFGIFTEPIYQMVLHAVGSL